MKSKPSKLPIQAAPVARNITGASMSSGNGVDPSGFLGDAWDAIKTYGPAVAKGIAGAL